MNLVLTWRCGEFYCQEELGTASRPLDLGRQWDVPPSVLSFGLFLLLRWEDKVAGSPVAALTSVFATHRCVSFHSVLSVRSTFEELKVDHFAF